MGKTLFDSSHVRFGKPLLKTIMQTMQSQVYRAKLWYRVILFLLSVAISAQGTVWASATPKITAGGYHCLALMSDETVWAWGDNSYG